MKQDDAPSGLIAQDADKARHKRTERVQAIRIGGRDAEGVQRRALSIEVLSEGAAVVPAEESVAFVAWEAIAARLAFSRRERAVWFSCLRDGKHYRTVGITAHEFGAIQRELFRRLKTVEASPFLGYLTESELFFQKFWDTRQQRILVGPMYRGTIDMEISKLRTALAEAKLKHERISERAHQAEFALVSANAAVEKERRNAKLSAVDAMLNDQSVQPVSKKLAGLQAEDQAAQETLEAANGALVRQAAVIEELKGEISACREEACMLVTKPLYEKFLKLQRTADELAQQIDAARMAEDVDPYTFARLLMPQRDPNDCICDLPDRAIASAILNASMSRGWSRVASTSGLTRVG